MHWLHKRGFAAHAPLFLQPRAFSAVLVWPSCAEMRWDRFSVSLSSALIRPEVLESGRIACSRQADFLLGRVRGSIGVALSDPAVRSLPVLLRLVLLTCRVSAGAPCSGGAGSSDSWPSGEHLLTNRPKMLRALALTRRPKSHHVRRTSRPKHRRLLEWCQISIG